VYFHILVNALLLYIVPTACSYEVDYYIFGNISALYVHEMAVSTTPSFALEQC